MRSHRASGSFAAVATLVVAAGCSGAVAPTAAPTADPLTPPPVSAGPATPGSTPRATGTLPAFADSEPLLLFALRTDLGGGVFVMAPDGNGRRQLATDLPPGTYKAPDWSPDGKHVVLAEEQVGELFIAHLDGTPTEIVEACRGGYCDNPAWSPDGGRLAFTRLEPLAGRAPAAAQIDVLDLASGSVTTAIRLERPLLAEMPRWSPDGTELVIQVDQLDGDDFETGAAIAIVPAAGGELRYLTDFGSFASSPDWGWVSREIVFAVDLQDLQRTPPSEQATYDLFGMLPDGTGGRQVTNLPVGGRLHAPRWTPDGRAVIAKQFDHGSGGGRLVDPTTGAVEPFVTGLDEARPLIRPGT